jgi:exopolyphosphatase / guanosine-5'-triphosphate,3'-diphosphate pyrophosphatase
VLVELAARHKGDVAGIQYLKDERLEAVRSMGERFGYVPQHSGQVSRLARQLFYLLQPLHELPEWYGELLEASAMLHDIGNYVNTAKSHKHSYYLIAHSELPGYTDRERLLIAIIARYHRGSWPSDEHEGYRLLSPRERSAVEKLAAIVRVADACDNGRRGVVQSLIASSKGDRIEVKMLASGPAELEFWAAQKAAPLFRKAFGRKLQIQVETIRPVLAG